MEKIKFSKMHGLGNDYIYVDMTTNFYSFEPADLSKKVSDRHFGVGSDGLILVMDSRKAMFKMRVFNADGSEAEMCGNGIRAFGKYVYDHRLTAQKHVTIETNAGVKTVDLIIGKYGRCIGARVDMGEPILNGKDIPVNIDSNPVLNRPVDANGTEYRFTAVSMGNPHCVIFVDEITDSHVLEAGPQIERNALFPKKANVEFAKVLDKRTLQMRVWERGSGETMACGTGASAVLVAGALNNLTERKATIKLPGGDLLIEWAENNHVYMTGPAEEVCEGVYYYDGTQKH